MYGPYAVFFLQKLNDGFPKQGKGRKIKPSKYIKRKVGFLEAAPCKSWYVRLIMSCRRSLPWNQMSLSSSPVLWSLVGWAPSCL